MKRAIRSLLDAAPKKGTSTQFSTYRYPSPNQGKHREGYGQYIGYRVLYSTPNGFTTRVFSTRQLQESYFDMTRCAGLNPKLDEILVQRTYDLIRKPLKRIEYD